jgi:hypothetical protein
MIKLINGYEIKYNDDFDRFFQNLLEAIITESKRMSIIKSTDQKNTASERDIFLQEIMDNSIYVTQQLFQIYRDNEKLTKFIITGFIFNSVIMALPGNNGTEMMSTEQDDEDKDGTLH